MNQVQAATPNRNLLSHNTAAREAPASGPSSFMKGLSDTVSFVGSVAFKGASLAVGRSAPAAGLLGGLGGGLGGGGGAGGLGGVGEAGDLAGLLQLQLEVQERMQRFTMLTNIAKTEHESRMSAVRNMRA